MGSGRPATANRSVVGPGGQRVGGDRIDLRAGELRGARGRGEPGGDEEREHRVHGDAREDHDRPFPHGLAVERARRADRDGGLPALDSSGHALVFQPRHLHVPAERQPREPVLGLPAPPAEYGTPEADREPQHLNPHGLRREEVAHFMNEDQRTEDDDERGEIQEHAASRARRRASASAASTVSSDAASQTWCVSSTRAMVSAIRPNRILPSRNSSTATSFAALNAVGAVPPAAAAARPSPYAGYSPASTGSKVRVPAATGSKRRAPASGTRSGWVSAYRMGSSIVGKPTCARTDPSTNSTNACTTDWGWTTTSTASYGRPNRKCASITSSALFTRLAESTVIFFPIFQVGWRNASSTVAPATRSGFQVRNGPPDAVRMSRASSPGRRPVMHCSTALCSESTGTISPPPSRAVRVTSSPAITSVSLLASATRFPARRADSVASSPAAPTMAFTTICTSGCVAASTRHAVPFPFPVSPFPELTSSTSAGFHSAACFRRSAAFAYAGNAATRIRSRWRPST